MAMFDSNIDYTKLIQFNGGTLRTATFVEIRDALVKRHKEIYGNDIDVSTSSADGQFINEMALILNNIVNTFAYSFKQMDPSEATGKYLDILCSYNNVQRIGKSASVAELYIFNPADEGTQPVVPQFLYFKDRNGQTWLWQNPKNTDGNYIFSFPPQQAILITNVVCESLGAIEADGSVFLDENDEETTDITKNNWNRECPGCISQFVDATPLRIWQYQDAIVGSEEETDESLRSRRYQMLGNQSVSVLEGLHGALLGISGIEEVFIMNNSNESELPLTPPVDDGTELIPHSIYLALRYKKGVKIEDELIGKLIYNKLTPGVGTTPTGYDHTATPKFTDTTAGFHSFTIYKTENIYYTIYWKEAQPVHPKIVVTMNYNSSYDLPQTLTNHIAETEVEKNIVKNLQKFISDISINDYMQPSGILNTVQQSDRQKQGLPTFFATYCLINSDDDIYPANLSYFDYEEVNYLFAYDTNTKECTITIGGSITMNNSTLSLNIGDTSTLTATLSDTGSGQIIIWKSSNTNVAEVDQSGEVRATGAGTATITATCGSMSCTCDVTVS